MVHPIMRASSSRSLLRHCINSNHGSTSTRTTTIKAPSSSRAYSSIHTSRYSRTPISSLSFPAFNHFQQQHQQLPQRRSISLWSDANSPAPIIGADGKIQKASDAVASASASTSTSTPVVPTAASEELGVDFQQATSTESISSSASTSVSSSPLPSSLPSSNSHHLSLETMPTELSESISETRRTLQEYGLGNSTPSGWVQGLLEWVHLTTGLPWYATIGVTVIAIRLMLFPIMVRGISNNARLARIQPELMANIAGIKKAQQDGNMLQVSKLQISTKTLLADNKCNPIRGLILPVIQMPLFISFFFALRGMAGAGLPDFANGGVAWFTNLSIPDPTYILPVISAAATLAVLQVGEYGAPPKQGPMKGVMAAFKLATPAIAYVASGFPAAVLVYWVTHNSFSVLQALIMKIPAFKRWADIPDPPVKSATDKSEGVGFMQAFRDTRDAFSDLKDNAVEKTDKEHVEKQQIKAEEKSAETRAARKKATLDQLKAGSTTSATALAEEADIAGVPVDEKQARLAAARKRRESLRSKRSRI